MPTRRSAHGAARAGTGVDRPFRPIPLVRVDLDTRAVAATDGGPGAVIWVEAVRNGQVVGLMEAHLDEDGSSLHVTEAVEAVFGDIVPDDVADVPDSELPSASVVVSTIAQRPEGLRRTMATLAALDYPGFEIIVVDNRATPGATPLAFPDVERVRVVTEPVSGVASARNRGLAVATGELVAFTDDDVVADPRWLRVLGSRFVLEPGVDALGGLVLPKELDTEAQLWFEEYYGGFSQSFHRSTVSLASADDPLFPYAAGRFGAGANMAFRHEALVAVGGFDPALGTGTPAKGGEDLLMFIRFLRAGRSIGFEPAAVVHHSHRRDTDAFLHQVRTYGTGLAAMYTSLVVHDPGTLADLVRRVPAGFRLLTRPRDSRSPSSEPSYPRRALAYQMAGLAIGPLAYAHSTVAVRRAQRAAP